MRQAAHDLASLLTVMTGYCEAAQKSLDKMKAAHSKACEIVKHELSTQEARPGHFDLNAIVDDLGDVLGAALGIEKILLVVELEMEELPILGDSIQTFRALLNLCMNARHAMPEGGMLRVKTARQGDEAILTVEDSGTGMTPEFLERLWEQCVSADGMHGHGLRIVKTTVKRLGGTIAVQSAPSDGTQFVIKLPIALHVAAKVA
jgi:signal transduction histidine kinase